MNPVLAGLKPVHAGESPPWWPPAPGWWLVAGLLLLVGFGAAWWLRRRRDRRIAILRLFDDAVDAATSPTARVAVMSELLRRAARREDPAADRLEGGAWLEFLDAGLPGHAFTQGAGTLLLDGAFRRDIDPADVDALRTLARRRYMAWMRA